MRKILSRLNRLSKRIIFFFSAIIVAILGIFIYGYLHSTSTQAAWFDDSWAYRKAVTLTDSAAETNKYAALSSYDASDTTKYQADCGDVRFTDQNGKLLVYTVTSCGASTTFNINIPSILNGTQTIYLYYGNPSVSNGFASSDPYTACATCSFGSPASEEKSEGPVGYWKFDDSTGQTTQDSTINNNDGTLGADSGSSTDDPTWTAEDQCVSGKCLKFDGGDYIKVGDASALNFSSTGAFSISTWIKTGTATGEIMVDSWIASAANNAYAFYTSSGTLKVAVSTMATNSQWDSVTGTTAVNDNKWHYVTLVYNNKTANLYVDGKLDVSEALTVGDATLSTDTYGVLMGANFNTNNSTFTTYQTGYLDEVKIYPYARSAAQIKADYASGKAGQATSKGTSVSAGSNSPSWMSNGLVGYWKMDEAATNSCGSNDSCDSSGNGNDGAWNGNVAAAAGKFGNGTTYDGTEDYTSFSDIAAYETSGTKTVSLWVKPATTDTSKTAASKYRNDTNEDGWTILLTNTGLIRAWVKNDAGTAIEPTSTYSYSANTWYNIAFTWDTNGGTAKLYVNGALHSESSAITGVFSGNSRAFNIGRALTSADGTSNSFNGVIDDVRIYNRVLSPKEVSDLYNWAPGPVGYWNMDEGSGTSAFDTSGNGNTGTATGTTIVSGKIGKARSFNGTSDFVSCSDASCGGSTKLEPSGDMSLSAWIKTSAGGANQTIIGKSAANDQQYVFRLNSSNQLNFLITQAGIDSIYVQVASTQTLNDGIWHHVAATLNDSSSAKVYIDGVLAATSTSFTGTSDVDGSANFKIGARDYSTLEDYFNGLIDDVKIYNYARTAKQVVSDMNAGHPNVGSPVGSAVGYWKFDEGADNTCSGGSNDACNSGSGGSALDGAQSGMAVPATATSGWTNSGKFGKALSFDGTNDYVWFGAPSSLQITNPTVSAWFKSTSSAAQAVIYRWRLNGTRFKLSNGNLVFEFYDSGANSYAATSPSTYNDDNWHHAVATYDGSNIKLYVDGVLVKTQPASATIYYGSGGAAIGRDGDYDGNYFAGSLDEVKIYNYALTADEVKLDMNQGKSLVLGATSDNSTYQKNAANQEYCVPGDSTSCAAPVGEWKMDEGTGTSAFDTSGNGYTGTLGGDGAGTDLPTWTAGKVGKGLSVDGSDDYINTASSAVYAFAGSFTVSFWIKTTQTASNKDVIDSTVDITANQWGYYFRLNRTANKISFDVVQSGVADHWAEGTTTVNDGNWHHVVGIRDASNQTQLYVDGKVDATPGTNASGAITASRLFFGANGSGVNFYNGLIDNVKIYNYARTPAQIAWDYNRGGPVGWWKFDECQGTTAYDNSGNANNGTITIGASGEDTVGTCTTSSTAWGSGATGKRNASLSFDGTDDYVGVSGGWLYSNQTVSFWAKPTSGWASATGMPISSLKWTNPDHDGFRFIAGTNQMTFSIYNNAQAEYTYNASVTGSDWHHFTMTWTGTTTKSYVDGVLVDSTDRTNAFASNTSDMDIGRYNYQDNNYFAGQVDDVRIYNYALTGTQIKNIYNGGFGIRFGPATGSP